tara:strand:- start:1744 stop:2139 length:396 start_codon:yes stop_codon:yes gene_type:complete
MSFINPTSENVSKPKSIPQKTTKSYCNTVASLDNKFCNQYTIREFLESPKESEDSPIQIINHFQLAMENNQPPNSFTPPEKKNLLSTILSYLNQKDQESVINYEEVSMNDDYIDCNLTRSPYKSMIFNLDN